LWRLASAAEPDPGRRAHPSPSSGNLETHFVTDKKDKKIFLIYKEIQNGAVAMSYMTNGLLIYGEIFPHGLIY
jgi:hypothetical protein